MKPKILLAGGTGFIGKALIEHIKDSGDVYTISKYPKEKSVPNIKWLKRDIYKFKDMRVAMRDMDIAIYYLDPTKHSAKITQATARVLNLIAADNFGRAAELNGVKKIIYVRGSTYDDETLETLGHYKTPIEVTDLKVKRPHVSVEFQPGKYDDMRSAQIMPLPKAWTINDFVKYYFEWLGQTSGTFVRTIVTNNYYAIYTNLDKKPIFEFEKYYDENNLLILRMVDGRLTKNNRPKTAKLEFRKIPDKDYVIVHLMDYIPKMSWPLHYFLEAPLYQIIMRGFEVKCRIKRFQTTTTVEERVYTK